MFMTVCILTCFFGIQPYLTADAPMNIERCITDDIAWCSGDPGGGDTSPTTNGDPTRGETTSVADGDPSGGDTFPSTEGDPGGGDT